MQVILLQCPTGLVGRSYEKVKCLQRKQPTPPRRKEAHVLKTQMKTVLITFFDIKGTVHFEFIPRGLTVSQAYYVEILKLLPETLRRKKPEIWPNDWILHRDSAPAHKTLSAKDFLVQKTITVMEHTLFLDLALNNFCFRK
jgi:hypothetical protein